MAEALFAIVMFAAVAIVLGRFGGQRLLQLAFPSRKCVDLMDRKNEAICAVCFRIFNGLTFDFAGFEQGG
jgi:hypothetical protein